MNFFLDENFPKAAHPYLVQRQHSCRDVRDYLPQGTDDMTVFQLVQEYRAVFLTTDKDFYHTVPFHCPSHHGVVVVSLHQPNRQAILQRLQWFLERAPASMENTIYLLRDRTFVVNKPPQETL